MRNSSAGSETLTAFRKRPSVVAELRKSQRPLVLTVKGKPALVVQTAESYLRLLDLAARQNSREGIRQGLDDVREGRTRPAKDAFADFHLKRGISS
jgi:PHD/YefM family antitoxin component YafN of YafNO toxin-antitoxin module